MNDGMTRSGTVILLGAGASRDASYPLASDIHEPFLKAARARRILNSAEYLL